jgi:hypothetical protein
MGAYVDVVDAWMCWREGIMGSVVFSGMSGGVIVGLKQVCGDYERSS